MKHFPLTLTVFGLLLGAALIPLPVDAEVKPNGLFTDGAVLQQGQKIPVFGSADEGEKVTVRLGNQSATTTRGAARGAWT